MVGKFFLTKFEPDEPPEDFWLFHLKCKMYIFVVTAKLLFCVGCKNCSLSKMACLVSIHQLTIIQLLN